MGPRHSVFSTAILVWLHCPAMPSGCCLDTVQIVKIGLAAHSRLEPSPRDERSIDSTFSSRYDSSSGSSGDDSESDDGLGGDLWAQFIRADGGDRLYLLDTTNEVGDVDCPTSKCTPMLSAVVGITDTNWLMDSMMIGVLEAYGKLATRAQYVSQPIGHRMARACKLMEHELRRSFTRHLPQYPDTSHEVSRVFPPVYKATRTAVMTGPNGKVALVKAVDELAEQTVEDLLHEFWRRLKDGGTHHSNPDQVAFWDMLLAFELADPLSNGAEFDVSDRAWLAVGMICERFAIGSLADVQTEIMAARDLAFVGDWLTAEDQRLAKVNLLAFFCEVYGASYGATDGSNAAHGRAEWKKLPLFALFAKAVFVIMVSSAVVEALFSRSVYCTLYGTMNRVRMYCALLITNVCVWLYL